MDLVLGFLKQPLRMWQTGSVKQKRLVLRLVFSKPLLYRREKGFETPTFSLPIDIACVLELDEMEMVDIVCRSWNTLKDAIWAWAEQLEGLATAKSTI
jgi:hypothetical protein